MLFVQRFRDIITKENLFSPGDRLLVATSGGLDSVVLCALCNLLKYDFVIAHCNFQLRGEESRRDEAFVQELGRKTGAEVLVKSFDTERYAKEKKLSIQEAARELRYSWFHETVHDWEAGGRKAWILTAHHADDNAETLLMNFCRGTGLHGLTGIPMKSGRLLRPLLGFSRKELEAFAREQSLSWVDDSSNLSTKYTRNLFRLEIIPSIQQAYPSVKENLVSNAWRFSEIEALYKLAVSKIIGALCRVKGNEVHIPIRQLLAYNNRALLFEIFSPYGFSEGQVEEVLKLASSESGHFINSTNGQYRLIRHRHWFIISPCVATGAANIIIDNPGTPIDYDDGNLRLELLPGSTHPRIEDSSLVAMLDASQVHFPLLLRRWKEGDYFYPLGMRKKKKIARFLIDKKLSRPEKERTWVIEMNSKIIWVVGHRIDDRFRIRDSTKEILRITSTPSH